MIADGESRSGNDASPPLSGEETTPSPPLASPAAGGAAASASGGARAPLRGNSATPPKSRELSPALAGLPRVVPRGALKSKQPSAGAKAAVLNRVADAMASTEAGRTDRFEAMHKQARWTKQYQDGRLALAERMVAVREQEAALQQRNNDADQRRRTSESITARMLQLSSANVSVADMLAMQREWISGGGEEVMRPTGGSGVSAGGRAAAADGEAARGLEEAGEGGSAGGGASRQSPGQCGRRRRRGPPPPPRARRRRAPG